MPNQVDGAGIHIESYADILNDIINGTSQVPGLIQIYGSDINTASNTPDGQLINIFALAKEDVLQLCVSVFDSFDPDQAVGTALDSVSQLCGIARKGGSYTETAVVLTTTSAVNLVGLDATASTPLTVADNNGNEFNLITSISFATATTPTLDFRATNVGFVQVIPNTITNIVTTVLGVITANNPSSPYKVGADQETDAIFRLRRQNSVSIPAQGAFYGLYAGLLSIYGLSEAVVYENNTNTAFDAHGVPAHSIWVIVDGGAASDIGNMIYKYLNLGCGMKGSQSLLITQSDGSTLSVSYDTAVYQPLYVTMHLTSKGSLAISTSAIATYLSTNYLLGIYEVADITAIDTLVHAYSTDLVMTSAGVSSTAAAYASSLAPSSYINKFVLASGSIAISI